MIILHMIAVGGIGRWFLDTEPGQRQICQRSKADSSGASFMCNLRPAKAENCPFFTSSAAKASTSTVDHTIPYAEENSNAALKCKDKRNKPISCQFKQQKYYTSKCSCTDIFYSFSPSQSSSSSIYQIYVGQGSTRSKSFFPQQDLDHGHSHTSCKLQIIQVFSESIYKLCAMPPGIAHSVSFLLLLSVYDSRYSLWRP